MYLERERGYNICAELKSKAEFFQFHDRMEKKKSECEGSKRADHGAVFFALSLMCHDIVSQRELHPLWGADVSIVGFSPAGDCVAVAGRGGGGRKGGGGGGVQAFRPGCSK